MLNILPMNLKYHLCKIILGEESYDTLEYTHIYRISSQSDQ